MKYTGTGCNSVAVLICQFNEDFNFKLEKQKFFGGRLSILLHNYIKLLITNVRQFTWFKYLLARMFTDPFVI